AARVVVPEESSVPGTKKLPATPVTVVKVGARVKLTSPTGLTVKTKSPLVKSRVVVRGEITTSSSLTTATANEPMLFHSGRLLTPTVKNWPAVPTGRVSKVFAAE